MATIIISEVNLVKDYVALKNENNKLPKLVNGFNKLLVKNIRKEIEWYR